MIKVIVLFAVIAIRIFHLIYLYIYIYIYMCVCVCVCVFLIKYLTRETVYVKRNVMVRSRNHCCHGNKKNQCPLHSYRTRRSDANIINVLKFSLKVTAIFCPILNKSEIFRRFIWKFPSLKLRENPLSGSRSETCEVTDGQIDMAKSTGLKVW
jgi:hypothetical protein